MILNSIVPDHSDTTIGRSLEADRRPTTKPESGDPLFHPNLVSEVYHHRKSRLLFRTLHSEFLIASLGTDLLGFAGVMGNSALP